MPNGLTETQMVERMYTELIGLDGNSGMKKDVADGKKSRKVIYDRMDTIEANAVTKKDCKSLRAHDTSRKRNRWLVTKDIVLIILGPAGGAGLVVLLIKYFG